MILHHKNVIPKRIRNENQKIINFRLGVLLLLAWLLVESKLSVASRFNPFKLRKRSTMKTEEAEGIEAEAESNSQLEDDIPLCATFHGFMDPNVVKKCWSACGQGCHSESIDQEWRGRYTLVPQGTRARCKMETGTMNYKSLCIVRKVEKPDLGSSNTEQRRIQEQMSSVSNSYNFPPQIQHPLMPPMPEGPPNSPSPLLPHEPRQEWARQQPIAAKPPSSAVSPTMVVSIICGISIVLLCGAMILWYFCSNRKT